MILGVDLFWAGTFHLNSRSRQPANLANQCNPQAILCYITYWKKRAATHTCKTLLNPFQIVSRFTFLISSLTTGLIQSFVHNITFFLLCIGLLIKVLQERLKFDYICTNFLNKMSGQTWGKKVKRLIIWDEVVLVIERANQCKTLQIQQLKDSHFWTKVQWSPVHQLDAYLHWIPLPVTEIMSSSKIMQF